MDLKSTNASPVLADPSPMNKSRLGIHSNILPSGSSFSRKKPGKLDDVRSNGWLDAMQSSSPPHKRVKDFNILDFEAQVAYQSWMVRLVFLSLFPIVLIILTSLYIFVISSQIRYPSALNSFQTIMNRARNRKLVVFLDYDGTLSPIVDDPDRAFMSSDVKTYSAFE